MEALKLNLIRIKCILVLVLLNSCSETPSYNPFDAQENVSTRILAKHNCDTISAGCGYFNLTQKKGRLKTYYQVLQDDWEKIVGKGCIYIIDSIHMNISDNFRFNKNLMDSLTNLPLDINSLNKEFKHLNYSYLEVYYDTTLHSFKPIYLYNSNLNDTVKLNLMVDYSHENRQIVRTLAYYKYFNNE